MNLYFATFDIEVKKQIVSIEHALIASSFEHLKERLAEKQNVVIDYTREQPLSSAWDKTKLQKL